VLFERRTFLGLDDLGGGGSDVVGNFAMLIEFIDCSNIIEDN
jgi:hypothetical protein